MLVLIFSLLKSSSRVLKAREDWLLYFKILDREDRRRDVAIEVPCNLAGDQPMGRGHTPEQMFRKERLMEVRRGPGEGRGGGRSSGQYLDRHGGGGKAQNQCLRVLGHPQSILRFTFSLYCNLDTYPHAQGCVFNFLITWQLSSTLMVSLHLALINCNCCYRKLGPMKEKDLMLC